MNRLWFSYLLEALAQLRGNREVQAGEIFCELRRLSRTENHRCDAGLPDKPVQGNLSRSSANLFRDIQKHIEDTPIMFAEFVENRIRRQPAFSDAPTAFPLVLTAQKAARQRAPRAEPDTEFLRGGDMLALDVALGQRVFKLQGGTAFEPGFFGKRLCTREIPGGRVGEAVIADFSLPHQISECANDLFDGSDQVPRMKIIKVDVVGLQAAQRTF